MNLLKSIKNRKGMSGAVKGAMVFLTLAFIVASVSYMMPAYAQHVPIVTITPAYANCDNLGDTFTVHVANSPNNPPTFYDSIFEVRVYRGDIGIDDFYCGPAPTGWTLSDYAGGDPHLPDYGYCEYKTTYNGAYVIQPGQELDFTFDAVMSDEGCESTFLISTLDNKRPIGEHVYSQPTVKIDCVNPTLEKTVGEPKVNINDNNWWITQNTNIHLAASDNTDKCDLGIDYCRWRVTIDGVEGIWNPVEDGSTLGWDINFKEDSNHHLEVECYDLAGNKVNLVEDDKVDSTPPVTTKQFNGPQKIKDGVEWIDGVTTVTLNPTDPDPTGYKCNIGVDKTWYKNILWGNEEPCWDPSVCQALASKMKYCDSCEKGEYPKECIDDIQKNCEDLIGDYCDDGGIKYDNWYDCVEKESNCHCCGGWNWNIYDGNPIPKPQESCHVLYYFSVDNLGNLEPIKANCFFVDKTPPMVTKDNGNAILDGGEPMFITPENPKGEFHWLTTKMPITFTCDDSWKGDAPHPSGDEQICYKVSYDYPQWGYITDAYCSHPLNQDGYCCEPATVANPFVFYFKEESMHNLEYYCIDAVEKKSPVEIQYYKVDDTAPSIVKSMIGNYLGDCPPTSESDECYVADNGQSGFHVEVDDNGINNDIVCAVDNVECNVKIWWHTTIEECKKANGLGYVDGRCLLEDVKWPVGMDNGQDFYFTEDSTHDVEIECHDSLGNTNTDKETFLVDSTPPVTTKTYGEPFKVEPKCYGECEKKCTNGELDAECLDSCIHEHCVWWITSQTPITLTAKDNKVGVDTIYWRNLYFPKNDEICYKNIIGVGIDQIPTYCHPEYYMKYVDDQNLDWNKYTGPFYKPEESCHVIEYYSVDKLGNEEPMKWQCVFVDNTAPKEIKTVGKPSLAGDGSTFDYWVTQNTPITLDCKDPEPHPVDQETMCYRVSYDLSPTGYNTEQYCKEFGGTMTYPTGAKITSIPNLGTGVAADRKGTDYSSIASIQTPVGPCSGASQSANQCAYLSTASLPQFVIDTIEIQGGILTNPGCDNILVLSSGNPTQAGYMLSEGMGNPGCGTNPDGYGTHDCVILPSYTPDADSLALAISSEWPEYYHTTFTDWMQIGGLLSMSINSWPGQPSLKLMPAYGPSQSGSVALSTIAKSQTVQLRVADSGDSIYDTAIIVVPLACFNEPPQSEKCGDGIINPGEECDDGNTQNGDGCSSVCLIETGPGWCCAKRDDKKLPYTFNFMEDSKHDLEFYCKDHLGNTAPVDKEWFKVDTVPPAVTFTFNGAHFVKDGADYIDTASWLTLTSQDGGPICAVGGDEIYWQNFVYKPIGGAPIDYCASPTNCVQWNPQIIDPANWNLYKDPIYKSEESCHVLAYYAKDALGNLGSIEWKCFYVDKQPPVTTKTYGKPLFTDGKSDWITSATKVKLEATDPEPHPSGVKETKYRVTLLDDNKPCLDADTCNALKGKGDFGAYEGEFTIPEESCHLIEYYSVDNVGKTEAVKKQCVFVDITPPTVDKVVNDPKQAWEGDDTFYPGLKARCAAGEIDCWKVTLGTVLNLGCKDPEPHPVDHNTMCFQIELDGDYTTEKYCSFYGGAMKDDKYCCIENGIETFHFLEESQHDLKVKCTDALGNAGPVDEEKFKVEGCPFEICLNKKWNLISVPFTLFSDKPEVVFKDVMENVSSIWSYDNGQWYTWEPVVGGTLTSIKPGYGYWILAKNGECFEIAGSLFSPLQVPPSRALDKGWNLIGYYGNTGMNINGMYQTDTVNPLQCEIADKPVYCSLNSLIDTQEGFPRWSSLYEYYNFGGDNAGWNGLDACIGKKWNAEYMKPGQGYWIEMDVQDGYAPATNCIWNSDLKCVPEFPLA